MMARAEVILAKARKPVARPVPSRRPRLHGGRQAEGGSAADRVVVRPEHVKTEAEMGEQLERMAEAVLR